MKYFIVIAPEIATTLYPHQKKALTFLLERERERPGSGPSGKHSSLWQERMNPITGQRSWTHLITQREISHEPQEAKSSILADDVCIIICWLWCIVLNTFTRQPRWV